MTRNGPRYGSAIALAALLMTTACGRDADDPAAGGLSVGEAEQLDAAASRLDDRPRSPVAADSEALERATEAGIAQESRDESRP